MKKLLYSCGLGSSAIYVGDLASCWGKIPEAEEAPIITSQQVASLYPCLLGKKKALAIPDSPEVKSLDRVKELYQFFLDLKLDRSSLVIGAGGGSICDLVGFAASTFLRGISFILVPTTLLAQVDAAVGGKTALDLGLIKNVIGTFALPQATFVDPKFILTLPEAEILNGLAEVTKHALIASSDLFFFLQENWPRLLSRDLEIMEKVIVASLQIKTSIVSQDAREAGSRRLLNLGHSFAHAAEKEVGLGHGQAVAWGLVLATKISALLGYLDQLEANLILSFLFRAFPFLLRFELAPSQLETILGRLEADKKRQATEINFVLLRRLGQAETRRLPLSELKRLVHDLC